MGLADRITDKHGLDDLGINVLKLPAYKVDSVWTKHKPDANLAANELLHTWLKKQTNRHEAYTKLITALHKCEMNQLATELQHWATNGTSNKIHLSKQRMYFLKCSFVIISRNFQIKLAKTYSPYIYLTTYESLRFLCGKSTIQFLNWIYIAFPFLEQLICLSCRVCNDSRFLYLSGLQEIERLTKQSMSNKPFCLASGKQWTLSPTAVNLREIYTDLSWTRIHRKICGDATRDRLKNITQILSDDRLDDDGPVRVLVKGNNTLCMRGVLK